MTFTPNIPQATDDPSVSQGQILSNFQVLNNVYGTIGDHYPWTDVNGGEIGKHAKITFPGLPTATAPGNVLPTPLAGNNAMFGQTQSGITMPYYRRDGFTTTYAVSPIKAYSTFIINNNSGSGTQLDSFGMTITATTAESGGIITCQWHLINPMRTTNYGVIVTVSSKNTAGPGAGAYWYTITDVSNFVLYFNVVSPIGIPQGTPFNYTVLVLEF